MLSSQAQKTTFIARKKMFQEIVKRLEEITKKELEDNKSIGELAGVSGEAVRKQKEKDKFPEKWAFKIGQEYGECPNWILTGEKKLGICQGKGFTANLITWISKEIEKDPREEQRIELTIEEALPKFKEWLKKQ